LVTRMAPLEASGGQKEPPLFLVRLRRIYAYPHAFVSSLGDRPVKVCRRIPGTGWGLPA
jgi:hypothetical protein